MSDDEARAKERLANVAEQVNRMEAMGEQYDLECPYCGGITQPRKAFCCHKMLNAVGVIIEAIEKFKSLEMRHRVN